MGPVEDWQRWGQRNCAATSAFIEHCATLDALGTKIATDKGVGQRLGSVGTRPRNGYTSVAAEKAWADGRLGGESGGKSR